MSNLLLHSFLFALILASTTYSFSDLSSSAEKFIRSLNILPKDASPESSDVLPFAPPGSIVERPLYFSSSSGNGSIDNLGHHAGYYRLADSYAARMFYFFFESRNSKEDPVVIWLTGGPGCSSELALFYENGPFKVTNNLSLVRNDFGWDKASNLIYVDQPTGTGFSYSSDSRDIRRGENGVSNDLYDFLQAFFLHHPEYAYNDFYITGESYAGHYIPALASRVQKGNKAKEGIHINLKGLAIGSGLTNPLIQYESYTDYALQMGLINISEYRTITKAHFPECERTVKLCGLHGGKACVDAFNACEAIFDSILDIAGNINYYDIRKECVDGNLCYDLSNIVKFLNLKSVRKSLGVGDIEFVPCSTKVYDAMMTDLMMNLEVGLPALLDDGIRLLVFVGEFDLICNWIGNSRWVHAMEWTGQKAFLSSPSKPFHVEGREAGELKSHGPLTFLKLYGAGHLIPTDQPLVSLVMLKRWMREVIAEEEEAAAAASKSQERHVFVF